MTMTMTMGGSKTKPGLVCKGLKFMSSESLFLHWNSYVGVYSTVDVKHKKHF